MDFVSADLVTNIVARYIEHYGSDSDCGYCLSRLETEIEELPTVKLDRKRGHWIDTGIENVYGGKVIRCNECGFTVVISPEHYNNIEYYERFCCHCGSENTWMYYSPSNMPDCEVDHHEST